MTVERFRYLNRWQQFTDMPAALREDRDRDLEEYLARLADRVTRTVTSTTRPTGEALYPGLRIFESDTGRELMHDGTGWVIMSEPAQAWTPTTAGLTVTSGTWSAFYHRSDGWCDWEAVFTFGASSAVTADVLLTLPVARSSLTPPGSVHVGFYDTAGGQYPGMGGYTAVTTSVWLRAVNTAGTYAVAAALSATVPFTWGTGDILAANGRHRMATRYS